MLLTLESDVKNEHLILVYNSSDHKAKSFACFDIFPVTIKLFNTLFIFLILYIIYSLIIISMPPSSLFSLIPSRNFDVQKTCSIPSVFPIQSSLNQAQKCTILLLVSNAQVWRKRMTTSTINLNHFAGKPDVNLNLNR